MRRAPTISASSTSSIRTKRFPLARPISSVYVCQTVKMKIVNPVIGKDVLMVSTTQKILKRFYSGDSATSNMKKEKRALNRNIFQAVNKNKSDFEMVCDGIEGLISMVQKENPNAKTIQEVKNELFILNPNFAADKIFLDVYPTMYAIVQVKKQEKQKKNAALKKLMQECGKL